MLNFNEAVTTLINSNAEKINTSAKNTLINSTLAGIFIAIVSHVFIQTILGFSSLNAYSGKIIGSILFPIGIFMIVLTKSELFTGNILLSLSFFEKKINLSSIFKNWILVYIGNFIGSLLVILTVYNSGFYSAVEKQTLVLQIATTKVNYSFTSLILLGIFCNILVCLSVFFSFYANSIIGKFFALWAPVIIFVVAGFEHSIANMFFLPLATLIDSSFSILKILSNLIPVTLGNIIGGIIVSLYIFNKSKPKKLSFK